MAPRLDDKKTKILYRLSALITEKLSGKDAQLVEQFARHYYRGAAPVDLIENDVLDLYGAVLAHQRFGAPRKPGETLIRVYNPQLEQHGWQSTHTVVEIVTDDMPFLVDSVGMALNDRGLMIHQIIHPIFCVSRTKAGKLQALHSDATAKGAQVESFMHFEFDRQSDPQVLHDIEQALGRVLGDVRAAVSDWREMMGKVDTVLKELAPAARHMEPEDMEEFEAFVRWIADNHFTFLGYGCYDLTQDDDGPQLRHVKGSNLGILRAAEDAGPISRSFAALPIEVRNMAADLLPPLQITKANTRSTVHRPTYLDYIGIKRYDRRGNVIGEHRILGLFTSFAYNRSPRVIPLLRRKLERIVKLAGLPPTGHDAKALTNIMETYPRDELFQTPDDQLLDTVMAILQLQERQRIRLFLRRDPFARFVSCLIFVPRERYNTGLRARFQEILREALGGTGVQFQVQMSESILARVLYYVRTPSGAAEVVPGELEARLVEAARAWPDILREGLIEAQGEEEGNRLFRLYGDGFPVGYQDRVPARNAVPDTLRLEQLTKGQTDLAMFLYRPLEQTDGLMRFKLIQRDEPIHLSAALPVLENMGLRVIDEIPHAIGDSLGKVYWLHDFGLRPTAALSVDVEAARDNFQHTFAEIWNEEAENDGFNRLVLLAGLSCRQVVIIRAYCKYLLQVGIPFSQAYVEQTLANNAHLARLLAEMFHARFDPDADVDRDERFAAIEQRFVDGLDAVANLDEDRILRRYRLLIKATLRTNVYQRTGKSSGPMPYLSLKFDPRLVPDMPLPRPAYEIFVYSVSVEGVHLRGGKVARGGLRWSDRREDFRTEILGLMKAQMVKNGVIVPVGAKGGFVVKRPPVGGDRAAMLEEGIACYTTFLKGLLDITDNRVGDDIVPPERVVRYDDDDPYLVVAADKGTATFSDIANGVSQDYEFWLDDAFASGGSAGYDHKKMAITARGAWESVKHHFHHLGKDCQSEAFTAVGIGDMSGDVFGNGMLLSHTTRLIAAFDHRHIFIDPDPDMETSFAERQRLYDLPRSSWDDYDRGKLSAGGGIFERSLKSIRLSDQARAVLGIDAEELTPMELMNGILKAPVELFWNGGIGTYVKATTETNAQVRDRANDAIRVDAPELRCKIVGEGGNLGLTQTARIEFAANGGHINTDFIDNSAGVDCSDHEVNIKILLGDVLADGDMTRKQRDVLLAKMTDEVADLCLRDNVLQNMAISMAESRQLEFLDAQMALMDQLEANGRLNREIELLPSDEVIIERRQNGRGLARPELATLLAYGKMTLYEDLVASDVPDDPYFVGDLHKYFPRPLRRGFAGRIDNHRLRREIVATWLANSIVNRGLEVFVNELSEETGASPADIARAYVVTRDTFGLVPMSGAIEQLGSGVDLAVQIRILNEMRQVLFEGTQWFLRNMDRPIAIKHEVERFSGGIQSLMERLAETLGPRQVERLAAVAADYQSDGIGENLAERLASVDYLLSACDIVQVAGDIGVEIGESAKVYYALAGSLNLGQLREHFERVTIHNRWDRLALGGLQDDVYRELRRLTVEALADDLADGTLDGAEVAVPDWLERNSVGLARCRRLLADMEAAPAPDVAMLSVVVRSLSELGRPK